MSLSLKIPVVFVTPSRVGVVNNGPATYAKYLWESFVDHPAIDFHLVTPESNVTHDRIHVSGMHRRSRTQYEVLQQLGLEVAASLKGKYQPIIHGNTAHTMWLFKNYDGPVFAQVNDYDAACVFSGIFADLFAYGPRRVASLLWRHVQERKAMKFLDRVICNSNFTKQQVLRTYRIKPIEKAVVIYKAVDLAVFNGHRPPNDSVTKNKSSGRRVLFVGCNWHRKGLDNLIDAVALLDGEFSDVSVTVAGAQGQTADARIRKLPEKLGIANRINFLGRVGRNNLVELYSRVDVFCLPSRQEALGVSILEALAAGLPVLCTRVGGITEILSGSKSSSLVDPDSPEQIAKALKTMLAREKTADSAESLSIASRFSKETMIQSLLSLYNSVACSANNQ